MATGTITSLRDRGFGFITPEGGARDNELFFHHSAVAAGGFEHLQEGQQVTFEQGPDPRDPSRQRATTVSVAERNER
jgi:CspA family cold shock protein